ncbi:MAG: Alanine--tRNA ligase [Acidobacteria bacterium ADurb.Bin340]|nr:MAG: Alanine--tRNA ligase [Acidobacteria bacterium ADurb.Bin340]
MDNLFAYQRDAYQTGIETRVVRAGNEAGRPFAVLEDTVFYPEGGGQPSDRGLLGGVPVLEVVKRNGEIRHVLAEAVPEGPVVGRLDWERRFDHMQQHTGQHLLTAVAQDRFGWATTAFHLGPEVCDVELAVPRLKPDQVTDLEAAVAEAIRAARPVSDRWVSPEAYAAERVRSRGLPEGHTGPIRLVGIEGLDLNTCGGTHLRNTSELEALALLGAEPHLGGMRVLYAAGGRVRARMRAHEQRNLALRTLLGAPDADLASVTEQKLAQLQASERRARHLEDALADALAEALASRSEVLVDHHLEGQDAGFLGKVARAALARNDRKVLLLTALKGGQAAFVVAAAPGGTLDVAALGREVAALLEGRGGGNAPVFQGKAGSLARRAEAVMALRSRTA